MKRRKIWELDSTLHCSLVGTCLTTAELRALVRKFVVTAKEYPTDHELHGIAVTSVGKADLLGKQIQKAMDRRHHIALKRFDAATSPAEVLTQWAEAMKTGDIPGAYWAALTHGETDQAVVRKVFGEVHMLSHLVGAANRADIRRLHQLEETNATLEATIARQSTQLRDGIMARDAKIRELTALATSRIEHTEEDGTAPEVEALHRLVADLKKQVNLEIVRRQRAEKKVE